MQANEMRVLMIPLLVLFACKVVLAQANGQGWRGIVPLHSQRSDVERLLGLPPEPRATWRPCQSFVAQKLVPVPPVQTIAEGVIWRESAGKDDRPPWKEISITNVSGFKTKPRVGDAVTVIALASDIAPFDLRILKAERREDECDESLPHHWEVELEQLTQKKLFDLPSSRERNATYPFDVVVIYPAVKSARQISKDQLTLDMLPRRVLMNTVKAAIDLNGDRKPDIVVVEYCCLDPRQRVGECDYTCGKTFKKVRNAWRLVHSSTPC